MTTDETDSRSDDADSAIDDSTPSTDDSGPSDGGSGRSDCGSDPPADGTTSAVTDPGATDRVEALEATVEALADRVSQLERNLALVARQQARETGNGVCPECNAAGALRVERTPAGKKRVRCSQCGERFD